MSDTANLVAFKGEIEILDAKWSLADGRMLEFRICGEAFDRTHPFKKFQQKRNGRMGTRFRAVFAYIHSGEQLLDMDVMLAAWKDSSTHGQSVKLWLDNEVDTHPFCGCTRRQGSVPGDMFALVLVELNDDDSAIDQVKQARAAGGGQSVRNHSEGAWDPGGDSPDEVPRQSGNGAAHNVQKPRAPRRLSSSVHLLVTSAIFVQWLRETKSTLVKEWTPELARAYTKKVSGIESLADLDRNPDAVKRYQEQIYRPYERWKNQHP